MKAVLSGLGVALMIFAIYRAMGVPFSRGQATLMAFAFLGWAVIDPFFRRRVDGLLERRRSREVERGDS